jgi:hypothetical protein
VLDLDTGFSSIFILSPSLTFLLTKWERGLTQKDIFSFSSSYQESLASRAGESREERAGKESRLQLTRRGSRGLEAEGRGRDGAGSPQALPTAPTPKLYNLL